MRVQQPRESSPDGLVRTFLGVHSPAITFKTTRPKSAAALWGFYTHNSVDETKPVFFFFLFWRKCTFCFFDFYTTHTPKRNIIGVCVIPLYTVYPLRLTLLLSHLTTFTAVTVAESRRNPFWVFNVSADVVFPVAQRHERGQSEPLRRQKEQAEVHDQRRIRLRHHGKSVGPNRAGITVAS